MPSANTKQFSVSRPETDWKVYPTLEITINSVGGSYSHHRDGDRVCAGPPANLSFKRDTFALESGYYFQRRAFSRIESVESHWGESTGLHRRNMRSVCADR